MSTPASRPPRRTDDTLGTGIEAGVMLVIFAGLGYWLDRWLDTSPLFVIALFVVGAIGLFARFKATYTMQLDEFTRERNAAKMPQRGES